MMFGYVMLSCFMWSCIYVELIVINIGTKFELNVSNGFRDKIEDMNSQYSPYL